MKNQGKAGLWLLGAVVVGTLGYWIFKRSKKTYAELNRRDEEAKEALKKSGLSEDEILIGDERELNDEPQGGYSGNASDDTERVDTDINLCGKLFHDSRYMSDDLPIDAVDTIDILANHNDQNNYDKSIVHVMQSFARKENRNVLDFIFEVPLSAISKDHHSSGNVRIGDFSRVLRGRWDHESGAQIDGGFSKTMEDIVRDPENLGINISSGQFVYCPGWVEAYGNIMYEKRSEDGTWKRAYQTIKLDKRFIEDNVFNPDHTTASEFVADLNREYAKSGGTRRLKFDASTEDYRNCEVLSAFLGIRVSFYIQDKYHMDGINPTSGLKIIEEIYNDLEISDLNDKSVFNYDKFLFYETDLEDDVRVYTEGDGNGIESIPLFHD